MSRIFEALQKAESERKQEPQTTFEAAVEQPPPSTAAELEPEAVFTQPRFSAVGSVAGEEQPWTSAAGLSFEGISRYPWKPAIDKLPSLMDRGTSVEQFRSLRSRLTETRDMRPIKSVLVTSGMPQEGKSFVSVNLAISLARHKNSKVLLIDGDMRRYTDHELLGTSPSPGLADYLSGKATVQEVLQRSEDTGDLQASGKTPFLNMAFIPGGNGGDRAADLSSSSRFRELLDAVSPFFDWIVIDSSPVLPVSDAVNLARSCDGVLLVARGGVTRYPVAQRAAAELKASNLLGFVLNAVHEAPQVGNYYGYNTARE